MRKRAKKAKIITLESWVVVVSPYWLFAFSPASEFSPSFLPPRRCAADTKTKRRRGEGEAARLVSEEEKVLDFSHPHDSRRGWAAPRHETRSRVFAAAEPLGRIRFSIVEDKYLPPVPLPLPPGQAPPLPYPSSPGGRGRRLKRRTLSHPTT